jgi:hypothetical protein
MGQRGEKKEQFFPLEGFLRGHSPAIGPKEGTNWEEKSRLTL